MKRTLVFLFSCTLLFGCTTSRHKQQDSGAFVITEISTDKTYGYTQGNPIKVGGATNSSGPANERKFLDALAGPNGESITYNRMGSCCQFKTKNGFMGAGLLDKYALSWKGLSEPVILYINMYDYGPLQVPVGLRLK